MAARRPTVSAAKRTQVAQRRTQAIQLRLAGAEWQQIADTLGYSDKAAANKDVTRALEMAAREQRASAEVLRETELQRLDRLQRGLWATAIAGDVRAVEAVLRVMDRRMKLLGLDIPPDVEERLRQEISQRVGVQMSVVFGKVLDQLGLSEEQRTAVPALIEAAVGSMQPAQRRQIDGELVDGEAA